MAMASNGLSVDVCGICFETNPHDEELMRVKCKTELHHHGAPTVLVTWSSLKSVLEEIPYCDGLSDSSSGSEEEMYASGNAQLNWNSRQEVEVEEFSGLRPGQRTANSAVVPVSYGVREISYQERCINPPKVEDATVPLTQETYLSKFYALLFYEEEKHVELLSDKCDGVYQLTTHRRGVIPPWIRGGDLCSRYGCLSGMTGDQIMYASQASERLFIVDQSSGVDVCSAEILLENMYGHYDELLIVFNGDEAEKLENQFDLMDPVICRAEFEVKHKYFNLLHRSLRSLNSHQIRKLIPNLPSHLRECKVLQLPQPPYKFLDLDTDSQQPALQKVVGSGPEVPVLISGAFGTGKTRLLAVATYHFIELGKQKDVPTRVLLCCHHQATADAFIEEYFGKMIEDTHNPWKVQLARITRAKYFVKSHYPQVYSNWLEFRKEFASKFLQKNSVVVVTTLLTGLNFSCTIGDKFFTHILLDAAAQVREPEAVAPLCMANQDTKIVLAGDEYQVGPESLVLGDIAQNNGLAKSLITRLLELYNLHHELPMAVLITNYRCHTEIVSLARTLFYPQSLKSFENSMQVSRPIWFVCSSVMKTHQVKQKTGTDMDEAAALINQLKAFFTQNAKQMEDVCIMATNRHQLSDITSKLLRTKKETDFVPTQFVPTYLIQGREFNTLFMSTVEALDPYGYSLDPTKSLCSPIVFNTAITRTKGLIVVVGNPYTLMDVEEKMGNRMHCWAEYLCRCFKMGTVVAGEGIIEDHVQELRLFVENRLTLQQKKEPEASSLGHCGLQNRNLVERHIQQHGSVDLLSLKSFFIGPSRVGKTTARRRLTYDITHISPVDIVPSTGIDPPLTVQLYHESSVLLCEERWKSLGLREQCRTLFSHVINNPLSPPSSSSTLPMRPSLQSTTPHTSIATTLSISTAFSHKAVAMSTPTDESSITVTNTGSIDELTTTHDPIDESTDEPVIDDDKPTDKSTGDMTDLIAEISTLVKAEDWATIQQIVKDKGMLTFLHIIDIGGQPEFHEILPLLLHGLALNLIFLNVTQDLDSSYTVIYRDDNGYSPTQYKSEFTIREIIQRVLCSIASLQTSLDHKPAAILVGTYFDQSSEADVLTLDQSIQEAFKDTNFMKNDILCQISESEEGPRYIHPLDNVSSDPSDIEKLRQLITNTVHQRFAPEQVPTSTLLLHLILRQKFEVRGWCSIEECVEVAKSCHISREDLLGGNGILQFLHDRFGTILYYRGLKIGQRVIINPNIILFPTTELFVSAFGAKKSEPNTADTIRKTGEIPQSLMHKVCSSKGKKSHDDEDDDDEKIPTSEIVELLASRHILYEDARSANEETTYFLPSLLYPDHNVVKESSDSIILSCLFYSPILFCPSIDFLPLGLFPAIVVKLSQNTIWSLDECERFRNRIRFYVQYSKEKLLHVELRTLSTHLELRIVQSDTPVNPCLIPLVRQELWDAVTEVSLSYPHTKNVKWKYAFYCPSAVSSGGHPHPAKCKTMEEPQDVVCSLPDCHGGKITLEDRHKCWFKEIQMTIDPHKELNESTEKPCPLLTVKELVAATINVSDWHSLGLQLNLTMCQLREIDVTYNKEGFRRIKAEMFDAWLKSSSSASWADLKKALKMIGENDVASKIEASWSIKSLDTTVASNSSEAIVSSRTGSLSGTDHIEEKSSTATCEAENENTASMTVRARSNRQCSEFELGLDYQTFESIQENKPEEKQACDVLKSILVVIAVAVMVVAVAILVALTR